MTLTIDISDDLKPEEARELLETAREMGRPIGSVVLDAVRELAAKRKAVREMDMRTREMLAA